MNNPYPHPIIAREGWLFVAISAVAALALSVAGWWLAALPVWLIVVFIVQFFRDPPRVGPSQPNAVLSPDPYLDRDALKISVFMNVFNVHSNRSPVDGTVRNKWYHAGSFLNAAMDKASLENERNALHIATVNGVDVTCVQVAGLIARRILCYVGPGDNLARGQRYGFIRFGSRVDIYLPPAARPRVAVGDMAKATSTIIAEIA
jgi:phosphatidylserine decarboxylase